MTKPEMLRLMRLLSALESLVVYRKQGEPMPVYPFNELYNCIEMLEKEILK